MAPGVRRAQGAVRIRQASGHWAGRPRREAPGWARARVACVWAARSAYPDRPASAGPEWPMAVCASAKWAGPQRAMGASAGRTCAPSVLDLAGRPARAVATPLPTPNRPKQRQRQRDGCNAEVNPRPIGGRVLGQNEQVGQRPKTKRDPDSRSDEIGRWDVPPGGADALRRADACSHDSNENQENRTGDNSRQSHSRRESGGHSCVRGTPKMRRGR